jgi:SAM-dependent methyltransferase
MRVSAPTSIVVRQVIALGRSELQDFTLVVNDDIRTQLTHHVGRHWMIDQLTVADVEDMMPFIPEDTTQVVDLCCGSGRVSIALDKLVLHGKAKFWLVDGNVNAEVENIKRHWDKYRNDRMARFYNKRDLTEECCRLNGFTNYEYIEADADLEWSKYPKDVDLLFSNRGIGCHWPLKLYESVFPRILKDGATCIFMNGEVLGEIPDYFSTVAVVPESIQDRELIVFRYSAS